MKAAWIMKRLICIQFLVFISFLVLGISSPALAGPMRPVVEKNEEKQISNSEAKETLQQLQEEVQKNIEKAEQIQLEEKRQEAVLKDIKNKLQQIEKKLPS